jgi:hypothetical protein
MVTEIWKTVKGDNSYKVSNLGNIKSLITDKILIQNRMKNGYMKVDIHRNGTKYVHRLVAEAFLSKSADNLEVNHKDFDKENNELDNLEWITHKENINHYWRR